MKIFPLFTKKVVSGGGSGPGMVDSFQIKLAVPETNAAPVDAVSLAGRLTLAESMAGQTEAVTLKVPAPGYADANPAPTDGRSFVVRAYLNGASGGGGTSNPANANGPPDGTFAVLQTAVAGSTSANLSCMLGNNFPNIMPSQAIYRDFSKATVTLPTSSANLSFTSSDGSFTSITPWGSGGRTASYDNSAGATYDLIALGINTLAKLKSLKVFYYTLDAAAGVSPAVMSVDGGQAELSVTF